MRVHPVHSGRSQARTSARTSARALAKTSARTSATGMAALFLAVLLLAPAQASAQTSVSDVWAWLKARVAEPEAPLVEDAKSHPFRVETVVQGLEGPWAICFVPDGRMLITEKPGRIRIIDSQDGQPRHLTGTPTVKTDNQAGLLDMALHPRFEQNRWIYLSYSVETDDGDMTQVSRHTLEGDTLTDAQIIFHSTPVNNGKSKHYGSRISFGADNKLYVTVGERGEGERAQDLMDLNGKTLRLNDDGSVPEDNPFVGRNDARPEIFSYGNRNSQGMDVQPGTGLIFQTEHGPSWNDAPGGGDEVNIIEAGKNYGWPIIHHRQTRPGMEAPLLEYTPAIAPAGCAFYTGQAFPRWTGDFFFTNLVGRRLIRVKFDGRTPVEQEILLMNSFGRLRDVADGPDGLLYVITSETDAAGSGMAGGDRLLRLVPADQQSQQEQ